MLSAWLLTGISPGHQHYSHVPLGRQTRCNTGRHSVASFIIRLSETRQHKWDGHWSLHLLDLLHRDVSHMAQYGITKASDILHHMTQHYACDRVDV